MVSGVKTAAVYIQKGGVGKTTSAAHLAVSAATDHGLDTCLLDLAGTQNDLATQFGMTDAVDDPDAPVSAVFGDSWDVIVDGIPDIVDRMVFETDEGPDLIPSDAGLNGADNNLASLPVEQRYAILEEFISEHLADRYDFVLLDLPGKEDNIALNGLIAAENVVVPLKPGEFERAQLDSLLGDLDELGEDFPDVNLTLSMIIPTMHDRTTNQSEQFFDELEAEFGDLVSPAIVNSANIGTLQEEGRTLFSADDPHELYETGQDAREAYRQATTQLLDRI